MIHKADRSLQFKRCCSWFLWQCYRFWKCVVESDVCHRFQFHEQILTLFQKVKRKKDYQWLYIILPLALEVNRTKKITRFTLLFFGFLVV